MYFTVTVVLRQFITKKGILLLQKKLRMYEVCYSLKLVKTPNESHSPYHTKVVTQHFLDNSFKKL